MFDIEEKILPNELWRVNKHILRRIYRRAESKCDIKQLKDFEECFGQVEQRVSVEVERIEAQIQERLKQEFQ